jgi:hypothetical protein
MYLKGEVKKYLIYFYVKNLTIAMITEYFLLNYLQICYLIL